MIILAYASVSPLILIALILLRNRHIGSSARFLNSLAIAHSGLNLALSVFALVALPLPTYFLPQQYFFIDRLGLYEVLIASTISLLAAVYARGYIKSLLTHKEISPQNLPVFYSGFTLLVTVVTLAFFSNNLAMFWIFLELTTVLSSILIVMLNTRDNIIAALKYVFIASTAMLFSFIGLIMLFAMSRQVAGEGTLNWSLLMQQAKDLPGNLFTFAFIFMFIGFGAKAGIAPFHTWLPPAHAKSPSVVSALLSAVLLNVGTYGILRIYAVAHQNTSLDHISVILVVFGVVTLGIAAFSMLARENIKKLIAFSSIEHMGLILIGIGLSNPQVLFWVVFYFLAHALIKTLLFFSAGILNRQYGGNKIEHIKNAFSLQPLATWGIILGTIAIIGTPLFPVFLAKLQILLRLGDYSPPVLAGVLLLLVVAAAAMVIFLVQAFSRQDESGEAERFATPNSMKVPIIILIVVIVVLGIYQPGALYDLLGGIVADLGY